MTERTGGRRPDYKILGSKGRVDGEIVKVSSSYSDRTSNSSRNPSTQGNMSDSDEEPTSNVDNTEGAGGDPHNGEFSLEQELLLQQQQQQPLYPQQQKLLLQQGLEQEEIERKQREDDEQRERAKQEKELLLQYQREQAIREDTLRLRLRHENNENRLQHLMDERAADMEEKEAIRTFKHIKGQRDSLSEDISDFIDENPADEFENSIEDLDKCVVRIEDLRSAFRTKNKELLNNCHPNDIDKFEQFSNRVLDQIKDYLKRLKDKRKSLRTTEANNKAMLVQNKASKLKFMNEEVKRIITSLQTTFSTDLKNKSDEEITKLRNEISDHLKIFQTIPKKIEVMMESGEKEAELKLIQTDYKELVKSKELYESKVNEEFRVREIEKRKEFDNSSLNIQLPKFSGYDSPLDIYTFKDEFEKLYLKSTPSSVLPDLLKNNHLEGSALSLVKGLIEIDEMWTRLKDSFGDSKVMLEKKLSELGNLDSIGKIRSPVKMVDILSSMISLMKDLLRLSKRHKIENHLFYGDAFQKIYNMLGESRLNRWLGQQDNLDQGENLWLALTTFLEKELRVCQQKVLIFQKKDKFEGGERETREKKDNNNKKKDYLSHFSGGSSNSDTCHICGESGHIKTSGPNYTKLTQYYVCKKFTIMKPGERFEFLKKKGLCFQCLFPGADGSKGKHKEGRCQRDYTCQHPSHSQETQKKHVLLCEDHKSSNENKVLLETFRSRCILRKNQPDLPQYAKEIKVSHYVRSPQKNIVPPADEEIKEPKDSTSSSRALPHDSLPQASENVPHHQPPLDEAYISAHQASSASAQEEKEPDEVVDEVVRENAVYILQTVKIDEEDYNIFYDGGCGDFCPRYRAILRLGERATLSQPGPTQLGGVGGITAVSPHGVYDVKLPLSPKRNVIMSGVCLDKITETFPTYPLKGRIESDIRRAYSDNGGNVHHLPSLPQCVGGDTDLMIGIKYHRYFPVEVFRMDSGLSIYESRFPNSDGSYGVIGGNHEIITMIDQTYNFNARSFLAQQRQLFMFGYQVNPDVSLLGYKEKEIDVLEADSDEGDSENDQELSDEIYDDHELKSFNAYHTPRAWKNFSLVEEAGSKIEYRCPKCRVCNECKCHEQIESISIKEEVEQSIIDSSVEVDLQKRITSASLPLIADPLTKLAPNKYRARKVYNRVLRELNKNPADKEATIKSERKLQDLGFVAWVEDLPAEIQKMLEENPIQNYFAWRVVYKPNSLSTPARLVFDGSQRTDSGFCFNDILAKGKNSLNALVEIFLRWRIHAVAYHSDIRTMYNCIRLKEEFWCFQRYLYEKDLDPTKEPKQKVIKTCIYGARSSGNQAERGLRLTAELNKDKYPEVNEVVHMDVLHG